MMRVRDNVFSVGSPMQYNFGDVGKGRGWWIYDTENGEPEFILNNLSPQFVDLKWTKEKGQSAERPDIDYHRVTLEIASVPEEVSLLKYRRVINVVKGKKKGILKKFIETSNTELDVERLLKIGKDYLS